MSQSGHQPAREGLERAGPGDDRTGSLEAVMFDMDGLLVDSEPLWFLTESAVMARLGGMWAPADQHALVGGSMASTVRYLLERASRQAEPTTVARWLIEDMVELVRTRPLPALPGVLELLAEVRAAGVPQALVTSSEPAVVDAVLSRLDVRFDVVVCAADVTATKPDPEGYRLAAAKLGADPRRCIALEDSPNGVAAAEAAGYRVIAVPSVVPVPDRAGRAVLPTLAGVTLDQLRELAGLVA
ncbi:MAG TPA: HAD family phosphatase [Streptosporangiaceae bacterium]|nr:HAD family phosphatase [Streptosporangiaceae bacterium]